MNTITSYPLRSFLTSINMPNVLTDIICEYVPESDAIISPVTITQSEKVKAAVLTIFTFGISRIICNSQAKEYVMNSENGNSLEKAIKWRKMGLFLSTNYFQFSDIERLRDEKRYKEYEFALAQLIYQNSKQPCLKFRKLNSYKKFNDRQLNTIDNKYYKAVPTELWNFCGTIGYNKIVSKEEVEIADIRLHDLWSDLNANNLLNFIQDRQINLFRILLKYPKVKEVISTETYEPVPTNKKHSSLICWTMVFDQIELLQLFVDESVKILQEDFDKAVERVNLPAIRILIKSSQVIVRDTQIQLTIKHNYWDLLQILSDHHPDPLLPAIQVKSYDSVEFLLRNGKRPSAKCMTEARNAPGIFKKLIPYAPKSKEVSDLIEQEMNRILQQFNSMKTAKQLYLTK